MLIPTGSEYNKKRNGNAENFLGILVKGYEESVMNNLILGGGGGVFWTLESGKIYEIVGGRRNILSHYETIAFLIALISMEDEFIKNSEEDEFWSIFDDIGFFMDFGGPGEYCMDKIFHNFSSEHKRLIKRLIPYSERLSILREIYVPLKNYGGDLMDSDEVLQRDMLLGVIMIQFLRMGVRPYMLETNKELRKKMMEEGRDWVYELSEVFHDFSCDQLYHMGGYGQMYESIKHQALSLQERKEKKIESIRYMSAVAMEDILSKDAHVNIVGDVIESIMSGVKKNECLARNLLQKSRK